MPEQRLAKTRQSYPDGVPALSSIELKVSVRAYHCLLNAGIIQRDESPKAWQIAAKWAWLRRAASPVRSLHRPFLKNFGRKTLHELAEALWAAGYSVDL